VEPANEEYGDEEAGEGNIRKEEEKNLLSRIVDGAEQAIDDTKAIVEKKRRAKKLKDDNYNPED